jgi:predicted O-methyltransferase YrrM
VGDGPRGSSQLVPYEGGYLACVHERAKQEIVYTHRLARFNRELTQVVLGKPFVFEHYGIEFCCGLARAHGKWYFSYGLEDRAARLAIATDDAIWAFAPDAFWDGPVPTLPSPPPPPLSDGLAALLDRVSSPPVSTLPGWCTEQKARRLAQLVVEGKPQTCVELGVFGGRSLVPIGLALQYNGKGHVTGVDPYTNAAALEGTNDAANNLWWLRVQLEEIHEAALVGVASAGLRGMVEIVKAKSLDVVGRYEDGSIDLLHQDSNHSEEVSVAEVRAWLPKVRPGGWWVFDDSDWPSTQAAQFLLKEAGCEKVEDHRHWAIYRKAQS